MASVQHLFRASKHRVPIEELTEVKVLMDSGLEGCVHAQAGGNSQVLLA